MSKRLRWKRTREQRRARAHSIRLLWLQRQVWNSGDPRYHRQLSRMQAVPYRWHQDRQGRSISLFGPAQTSPLLSHLMSISTPRGSDLSIVAGHHRLKALIEGQRRIKASQVK